VIADTRIHPRKLHARLTSRQQAIGIQLDAMTRTRGIAGQDCIDSLKQDAAIVL
jgi:hypothetical protein